MVSKIRLYFTLTKASIVYLVVFSTAFGYLLGTSEVLYLHRLFYTLISSALVAAGVCAYNQVIEWREDKKMARTRNRAIPSQNLSILNATIFSTVLTLSGLLIMYFYISEFMAFGGLITGILYLAVYTPLKKITWLNTTIGAIPGALPPLGGWVASSSENYLLTSGSLSLFAIVFLWQHSHFFIIAWRCRDDYHQVFQMITSIVSERKIFNQIVLYAWLTVMTSLIMIYTLNSLNYLYGIVAIIAGIWFLKKSYLIRIKHDDNSSIKYLKTTVYYLFIILGAGMVDAIISFKENIYF